MVGDPLADYTPTLIRFIGVAISLVVLICVVYFVFRHVFRWRIEAAAGLALIMPWFVGFVVFQVFPIVATFALSFTEFNLQQPPVYTSFKNYTQLVTRDIYFWPSLRLTFLFSIISVPVGVFLSLLLAILLNQKIMFLGLYRSIYYLPSIVPVVAVALLWRWIFNPDVGLLNLAIAPLFQLVGQSPPDWFGDENWVLPAFILMSLWGIAGNNMIILLGALKNLPADLYESAQIDGANAIERFQYITVPLMTPTIFFLLVVGFVSAMQLFTVAAFARATPAAGQFMNLLIYNYGFQQSRMGYAAALAVILFLILLAGTAIMFRSQTRWVYYEGQRE